MNFFSIEYEQELLKQHRETYQRMIELVEQQVQKPPFIQQKDVSNYYKGISVGTLIRYERQGLKRSEPVEGGSVWYATSELDRFMLENQK